MSDQQTVTSSTAPVLESMTFGMILDKAFHLYGRDFLLLVAITAIPIVIFVGAFALIIALASTAPLVGLVSFPLFIIGFVATGVSGGAMTMVVGNRFLGRDITFVAAYLAALRRTGPLIGGALLSWLFIMLGSFALGVPGVILALSYSLVSPVIMLEGAKGAPSLKRSRLLIKGYRWQTLVLYLMYSATSYITSAVLALVVVAIAAAAGASATWITYAALIPYPFVFVLLTPFPSVVSVLLYYNQRIRKEGFDLAFLAEAMAPHQA